MSIDKHIVHELSSMKPIKNVSSESHLNENDLHKSCVSQNILRNPTWKEWKKSYRFEFQKII